MRFQIEDVGNPPEKITSARLRLDEQGTLILELNKWNVVGIKADGTLIRYTSASVDGMKMDNYQRIVDATRNK